MIKGFEVRTAFFRPLWRRIVLVGFTLAWAGFELFLGNPGWAFLFAAIAAYLAWAFFLAFDKRPGAEEEQQ